MGNYPFHEKERISKRMKYHQRNEMPVNNSFEDVNDEPKSFNSVEIMTNNSKQNRTKKNNEINNKKKGEEKNEIGVNYDKTIENNNNLIDEIKKSKCKSKNKETEKELLENNRLLENKSNQKDDLIEKEKYIRFRENDLKELEQKLKVKQIEINKNENVLKQKEVYLNNLKNRIEIREKELNQKEKELMLKEENFESSSKMREEILKVREEELKGKMKDSENRAKLKEKELSDREIELNNLFSRLKEEKETMLLKENELKLKEREINTILKKEKEPILVGLHNFGTTCYMNAVLQSLSNTDRLTEYFLTNYNYETNNQKKIISNAYYNVVKDLWKLDFNNLYICPNEFKAILAQENPLFPGNEPRDSKDLIIFLLERMHKELNLSNVKSNYSATLNDH